MADRNAPREYDLKDPNELSRLYRECRGYLKVCHNQHGTDWEGREFAMDALRRLEALTTPTTQPEKDKS